MQSRYKMQSAAFKKKKQTFSPHIKQISPSFKQQ